MSPHHASVVVLCGLVETQLLSIADGNDPNQITKSQAYLYAGMRAGELERMVCMIRS